MMTSALLKAATALTAAWLVLAGGAAQAANQTPTTSPITVGGRSLPFGIRLDRVSTNGRLPTLQTFAAGQLGSLWVLIGGRTNGLHNFTNDPLQNFPPSSQNRRIWVVDTTSWQVWSRSLDGAGLSVDHADLLSAGATQDLQVGRTLYVVGGYGYSSSRKQFITWPYMTAMDLPAIVKWVRTPNQSPPLSSLIRLTRNENLRVTGGKMTMLGERAILAFGQNFFGGYGSPNAVQTYTTQVRSFEIVDDGRTIGIAKLKRSPETPDPANFRRRDFTMVPVLAGSQPRAVVLSGVFTTTNGVFTVPVEIGAAGVPQQDDPRAPGTFRQGMNSYDCATFGVYDAAAGASHNLQLGGISYITYNWGTGRFFADPQVPFTNQITDVIRDADGDYSQVLLQQAYPVVSGPDVARYRFGAEARVFLKDGIPVNKAGLVDLAALEARPGTSNVIGWVFGGIAAEKPNFGNSVASNEVFRITLTER
jgi:hypothetical protein